MKILLVTDTWKEINGVVTTLTKVVDGLRNRGHEVLVLEPNMFKSIPCPGYKEIKLSFNISKVKKIIDMFMPDAVHIATEGPLGLAARNYMQRNNIVYNTSYHTKFPEFIWERTRFPKSWSYKFLKWFHSKSYRVLVTTQSMKDDLESRGFKNCVVWSRGVDTEKFDPSYRIELDLPKPIFLNVGRVSHEKNLKSFLDLKLPGSKIIVGSGPQLDQLKREYPDAYFVGAKIGTALSQYFASADVFVFPSVTDTFGLVMLESMASGVPVAAYPVTGPKDIVENGINGYTDDNLYNAIMNCLEMNKSKCRPYAISMGWEKVVDSFLENLIRINKNSI